MSLQNSLLIAEFNPVSPVAESFRSLRTAIRHKMVRHTERGKIMMVTSPKEQEGKTTTISNLAVTYAQEGKKVLVIDCDLRNPSLHHIFQLTNDVGLIQCLNALFTVKDDLFSTHIPNLQILPTGGMAENPSELIGSAKMAELLHGLRENFDVILLDSPPVLDYADAQVLSEYSDGVMLVIKFKRTKRELAKKARGLLEQAGAKILGVIINQK